MFVEDYKEKSSMRIQLERQGVMNAIPSADACLCEHCSEIRRQQQESELRWVSLHRLFDR